MIWDTEDRDLPLRGNRVRRRGDRTDTVSVFNDPRPTVSLHPDEQAETRAVSAWLAARAAEGQAPETFGVFVRSEKELPRAVRAVEWAGLRAGLLDTRNGSSSL